MAHSQQSNRVNYEQLGISFLVPNGWQGQETNNGLLLQNQSLGGIILKKGRLEIEKAKSF